MATPAPVLVVNDTRVDRHHGCTAVMAALELHLARHGMAPVGYWPAHNEWRGNAAFDRMLSQARLVVVNGEGSIHHDRPAGQRLLEVGAIARAAGVAAALINTGWEANSPDLLAMLSDFTVVAARDSQSAAAMRAGAPEVRVVPDLSLCTPPPAEDGSRVGIGVTDNVERLRALALERLRRACKGRTVSIIHGESYAGFLRGGLSLRADPLHPARLAALLGLRHRLWRARHAGLESFVFGLAKLKLLVSGRFHACTLALVAGTPFVAQASNTGKIRALIADAGLQSWRAELPAKADQLHELAAAGWNADEDQARRAYLERARQDTDALFADLRTLAA